MTNNVNFSSYIRNLFRLRGKSFKVFIFWPDKEILSKLSKQDLEVFVPFLTGKEFF